MTTPTTEQLIALAKEAGFESYIDGRGRQQIRDSDGACITDELERLVTLVLERYGGAKGTKQMRKALLRVIEAGDSVPLHLIRECSRAMKEAAK